MTIKQGFIILCIEEDKLFLIIDENSRIKYFTTSLIIDDSDNDSEQFKTGLTMLRESNGKPATITEEELQKLIENADNLKPAEPKSRWSSGIKRHYETGAIYYYHYEWKFN